MTLFEYTDYKKFVQDWVERQPNHGYGLYSKMARILGTSSVAVSQIFKGQRDLSIEQAAKLVELFPLNLLETDYFLLLVQKSRAGSHTLLRIIDRQLAELRERSKSISRRIEHQELSDQDKATFYSSWIYLAIWLGASIPSLGTVGELSRRFGLSERKVSEVLRFLLERGLLIQKRGGQYELGEKVIHVSADSPFVSKHHMNWRVKAFKSMDSATPDDLHYSAPMVLSRRLIPKFREEIVRLIQEQTRKVADSPSEALMCLNIDWFEI